MSYDDPRKIRELLEEITGEAVGRERGRCYRHLQLPTLMAEEMEKVEDSLSWLRSARGYDDVPSDHDEAIRALESLSKLCGSIAVRLDLDKRERMTKDPDWAKKTREEVLP